MKRLILTIIAVFYLGVSSGATVHLHYCMGQMIEWGLVSKNPEKCGKCGMNTESSKDCCKNEAKQVKFESDQKISQNFLQLKALSIDLGFFHYTSETDVYSFALLEEYPISNAPPEAYSTPVFIRNCNFRI
ncbi:MAG TPA: hypothetical protein VGD22_14870 [Sphingobacteriaceae bacterium]